MKLIQLNLPIKTEQNVYAIVKSMDYPMILLSPIKIIVYATWLMTYKCIQHSFSNRPVSTPVIFLLISGIRRESPESVCASAIAMVNKQLSYFMIHGVSPDISVFPVISLHFLCRNSTYIKCQNLIRQLFLIILYMNLYTRCLIHSCT